MDSTHERVEALADLQTIGAGAVAEKFAAELKAVLANIQDPNTQAEAKRKVVLEFVFEPSENREIVITTVTARSVLGATKPTGDVLHLGRLNGEPVATVLHGAPGENPHQGVLAMTPRESHAG